ncbi:MAG: hypothetical protein ABIS06_15635 [Vicinamibacterales bacterium]
MSRATESRSAFKSLLTRLVRVPKSEIDAQEVKYQKEREALKHQPAKKPT